MGILLMSVRFLYNPFVYIFIIIIHIQSIKKKSNTIHHPYNFFKYILTENQHDIINIE